VFDDIEQFVAVGELKFTFKQLTVCVIGSGGGGGKT
jgi:cell division GTPase FtsZ